MSIRIKQSTISAQNKKMRAKVEAALGKNFLMMEPVGSRVTCNPAPANTDEDWLVLVNASAKYCFEGNWEPDEERLAEVDEQMKAAGYSCEGAPEFYTGNDRGSFRSWRKGEVNLILTHENEFYDKFMTATHLAARFNLLEKSDRISLFQAVLYGVRWENLEQPEYQNKEKAA